MCGIAGFQGNFDAGLPARMSEAIAHRGPDGAVFDEAQRWPELFSHLQGMVDHARHPGMFILTGSQQPSSLLAESGLLQ